MDLDGDWIGNDLIDLENIVDRLKKISQGLLLGFLQGAHDTENGLRGSFQIACKFCDVPGGDFAERP